MHGECIVFASRTLSWQTPNTYQLAEITKIRVRIPISVKAFISALPEGYGSVEPQV